MAATLDDVAAIVAGLPEAEEGERRGGRVWSVAGTVFAWERPFTKADVKRFGDRTPPDGPILAVRTADLADKEALLAEHPGPLFTIPHFDGYAAVLVHLRAASKTLVREALLDGWLCSAPPKLAESYRAQ